MTDSITASARRVMVALQEKSLNNPAIYHDVWVVAQAALAPSDPQTFRERHLDALVAEAAALGLYESTAEPRDTR